jgi:hypothetical protein
MKYREVPAGYQVTETFSVQTKITPVEDIITRFASLTTSGLLTISALYFWDGASGPAIDKKIGWGWFSIKLTDTQVPSCVHDALAQLMRQGLLDQKWLPYVNKLLNQMLKDRGMWWARRRWWMRGLWLADGDFAKPENVKKIYEAF